MSKKITLYIATSLDGYISRENGSVDFLDEYNNSGEDYGYGEFIKNIDNIIMGNTTYQEYGSMPEFNEFYKGKQIFVFSKKLKGKKDNITFVNENPKEFSHKLKRNTWMLGGASILHSFMTDNLIDEYIITIMPILLGGGIKLFANTENEKKLKLKESKIYKDGVIKLHYQNK